MSYTNGEVKLNDAFEQQLAILLRISFYAG
jgi:hypothetical protein